VLAGFGRLERRASESSIGRDLIASVRSDWLAERDGFEPPRPFISALQRPKKPIGACDLTPLSPVFFDSDWPGRFRGQRPQTVTAGWGNWGSASAPGQTKDDGGPLVKHGFHSINARATRDDRVAPSAGLEEGYKTPSMRWRPDDEI